VPSLKINVTTVPSIANISKGLKALELRTFNWRSSKLADAAGYNPQQMAVKILRKGIKEEFDKQSFHTPSGTWLPWKKTKKIGNRLPSRAILDRSGKLKSAWAGGQGGFKTVLKREVIVGVNHQRVPYASIVKAGGEIRITQKMIAYLWINYKYWIGGGGKDHITIPPRQHAKENPTTVSRLVKNYTEAYVAYAHKVLSESK